jgi:phosphatidylinositol alpha-1,6-mannosyltransferase
VLGFLALEREHDLWHFVFAPNPKSSRAASLLKRLRRKPVVQTIASRPRDFHGVTKLVFGDRVIALSRFTADAMVRAGVDARRLTVIPPPVRDIVRDATAQHAARADLDIPFDAPMFLYAGDLDFSTGARVVAEAAPIIIKRVPDAFMVFACRPKTANAAEARDRLKASLSGLGDRVRFAGEVEDLPALLASATAVPFPVDDLYGKVDVPYVVLESGLLRVPVIVASGGPLEDLGEAPRISPGDASALAEACVELACDEGARRSLGESLRSHVLAHHDPGEVAARHEELYLSLVG